MRLAWLAPAARLTVTVHSRAKAAWLVSIFAAILRASVSSTPA
jgi:hypothetical protein